MKHFLEGSILYKTTTRISEMVSRTFRYSLLHKIGSVIKDWYSNSTTNNIVTGYLAKDSDAKLSVTYRVLAFTGRLLDRLVGKIHDFFAQQQKTSVSINTLKAAADESKKSLGGVSMALILPFIAGYSLTTTVRGSWTTQKLVFLALFIILAAATFTSLEKWKTWIRDSIIYKVCHYIWE